MPGITIRSVAKECGLSAATVSRVLSGSDYPVKPQTRQVILDAARRAGYVPNMLARGLKAKVSNEIAVIIPSIQNPFYTSLVGGIEPVLLDSNYSMSLYLTDNYVRHIDLLVKNLVGKMIAGVIIASDSIIPSISRALHELKATNGLSVVAVDYHMMQSEYPGVYFDYFRGAQMATEYLMGKGHSRIAFAFCPMDRETRKARWSGIRAAYKGRGKHEMEKDYFESSANTDFYAGVELARAILKSGGAYTAVAANNDTVAVGLLYGLAEQRVRVPEEVSVIGFDDCIYAMMCSPALTTIRVPSQQMGEMAANMLLGGLGRDVAPSNAHLEPQVIERASVACPAKR